MEEIKYVIRNAKYIVPFLTGLSLLNLKIFYSFFNVKIGSYLGFEEYLAPFIDNLMNYFILLSAFFLLWSIFAPNSWKVYNTTRALENSKLNYWGRLKSDFKKNKVYAITLVLIYVPVVVQSIKTENYAIIFTLITFFAMHIRREIIIKHPELLNNHTELMNVLVVMTSLVFFSLNVTFSEIYAVKHSDKKVLINYNGNEIMCKDSLSYIGRIKSHTFIYNKKNKSTMVLDNSDIKQITFY